MYLNYVNFKMNLLLKKFKKLFGYAQIFVIKGELFILVPHNKISEVAFFLKYNFTTQFKSLIDVIGVDYPEKKYRFEVIYTLLSYTYNVRINLSTLIQPSYFVDSLCFLYNSANWLEREVWDLFGIFFINHPDLRRILTDYGFKGHPLRKDFPLSGFQECIYNDFFEKLEYKEVSLTQEYRNYDISS